jgi:hypothetical protein
MKKSATQARKQTLDIYPADQIPAGAGTRARQNTSRERPQVDGPGLEVLRGGDHRGRNRTPGGFGA